MKAVFDIFQQRKRVIQNVPTVPSSKTTQINAITRQSANKHRILKHRIGTIYIGIEDINAALLAVTRTASASISVASDFDFSA